MELNNEVNYKWDAAGRVVHLYLSLPLASSQTLGDIVKDISATRGTEGKYVALIFQLLLQSWGSVMSGDSCLE